MEFIEATREDIPVIREMVEVVWPHTFEQMLSKEQIDYMMDMMYSEEAIKQQFDEGHRYILARRDGQWMGYMAYQHDYEPGKTKLHKIYVMPAAQGTGLGKTYVEMLCGIVRKNDNDTIRLNVNRDNSKAVGFYHKLGFKVVFRGDFEIGQGYLMTDYIMEMDVPRDGSLPPKQPGWIE